METGSGATGDDEPLVEQQGAVLGVDEFVYFRSNATGWGVDESTRLYPFAGVNVFARTYTVTQDWMVNDADTAVITRTNQLDGWGTTQTFYRATVGVLHVPPGGSPTAVTVGRDPHFKVDYSVLGEHRVIAIFSTEIQPAMFIQSRADACAGVCPGGLICSLMPPAGIPTCSEPTPTGL